MRNLHVSPRLHPHAHRRWWFAYLSLRKASPKNSFSLRLKCEETRSRSSYDSSFGWKKITFSWTLPVTLNIRWPSLDKQLQQFPHSMCLRYLRKLFLLLLPSLDCQHNCSAEPWCCVQGQLNSQRPDNNVHYNCFRSCSPCFSCCCRGSWFFNYRVNVSEYWWYSSCSYLNQQLKLPVIQQLNLAQPALGHLKGKQKRKFTAWDTDFILTCFTDIREVDVRQFKNGSDSLKWTAYLLSDRKKRDLKR